MAAASRKAFETVTVDDDEEDWEQFAPVGTGLKNMLERLAMDGLG